MSKNLTFNVSQLQLEALLCFCENNVAGFKNTDCDESDHWYYKGELVGGFAGDKRQYFLVPCEESGELLDLYNAESN